MVAQLAPGSTVKQVTSPEGRAVKKIERRSPASAESTSFNSAGVGPDEGATKTGPRDRCLFDLMH
jgi:hypothetical protein